MTTEHQSPADQVFQLSNGMSAAAVVLAAARLGLADAVTEEPFEAKQLATAVGADPDALARLLRVLAAFGIFHQSAPGRYEHTDRSRAMRADHSDRLLDKLLTGSEWGWTMWGKLADAVRTGECAFPAEYGVGFFDYLGQNPEDQARMYRGMTAWSEQTHPMIADALDLSGARTVADMGGGKGALLRVLLEHNPHLSGVLFESEATRRVMDDELGTGALAARSTFVAGDFFREVPFTADVYLFKLTMHMYDDEQCVHILRNTAANARPGARIVIADPLLVDPPTHAFTPVMDLHMLLVMGGRERTEDDYARLLTSAGLEFTGITPTASVLHLAEATLP
ncbi:methyltransferase [Amycolatopsis sp. lyj-90]|uniref:methyltransferase n=1 Tax=Amycolatopsis sp. lyj-90 TaxID=2789285 RepID=UPI00397DAE65